MRDTLRVTQDERLEAVTLTTNPLHQVIAKRRQIGSTDEDGRIVERVTYDPDGTPYFWGEDTIRPRVTQLAWTGEGESPTGVTVDATTLVVRFSEAIHDATMAGLSLTLTPDPGSRTQALDGDGRTLRITFEQPIPATTPTTLHLDGLRDRTGNTIFPFDTTFTLTDSQAHAVLADTAAPQVLTVIDTATGLVLRFDEPVQPPSGTALHGAVTITRSGLPVDGTTTRLTETVLAWTPTDPASWQPGGEYRLTALTLQDLHSQPNPIQTASLPLTITHLATQPTDALLAYTAPTDSAARAASQYGQTALFQGREWHGDLGMYYYRARWYAPRSLVFVSRDPLGFVDGPSLHSWLLSSPFSSSDPMGTAKRTTGDVPQKARGRSKDSFDRHFYFFVNWEPSETVREINWTAKLEGGYDANFKWFEPQGRGTTILPADNYLATVDAAPPDVWVEVRTHTDATFEELQKALGDPKAVSVTVVAHSTCAPRQCEPHVPNGGLRFPLDAVHGVSELGPFATAEFALFSCGSSAMKGMMTAPPKAFVGVYGGPNGRTKALPAMGHAFFSTRVSGAGLSAAINAANAALTPPGIKVGLSHGYETLIQPKAAQPQPKWEARC